MEKLIIAGLATYRLALFISEDNGPFGIFLRFREWVAYKAETEQRVLIHEKGHNYKTLEGYERSTILADCEKENPLNLKWSTLAEGTHCPYCVGIYMAVLTFLVSKISSRFAQGLLKILAIAGLQSAVRSWAIR